MTVLGRGVNVEVGDTGGRVDDGEGGPVGPGEEVVIGGTGGPVG